MDSLLQSLQWKVARFAQVEQRSYRTIACTGGADPELSPGSNDGCHIAVKVGCCRLEAPSLGMPRMG
jgi:hypothetical protein